MKIGRLKIEYVPNFAFKGKGFVIGWRSRKNECMTPKLIWKKYPKKTEITIGNNCNEPRV